MDQWLIPVSASILAVKGGLPQEKRVALTAAALAINGPLGIAPALVAVERQRKDDGNTLPTGAGVPAGEVGPALVVVPDVEGQTEAQALQILAESSLKGMVVYNRSAQSDEGIVVLQERPPEIGDLVLEKRRVILHVGAGPAPGHEETEDERAIRELREDVDKRFDDLSGAIAELTALVKAGQYGAPRAGSTAATPGPKGEPNKS